jgi:hypothetical protein
MQKHFYYLSIWNIWKNPFFRTIATRSYNPFINVIVLPVKILSIQLAFSLSNLTNFKYY